jgi:hypothetical protein
MSKKFTFYGKVNPERVPITFPSPISGEAQNPLLQASYKFRVAIHASQCVIDLDVDDTDASDVFTLRNIAADAVATLTDLVGYRLGICFAVEIISYIRRDNDDWFVFGIDVPILAARRAGTANNIPRELLTAVLGNVPAMMVLADFRKAMSDPIGTGFHCYRALEAMMQSMKEADDEKDSVAWERLRGRLRMDRSAVDAIKAHADLPRHGRPSQTSDQQRAQLFELTDEIINRFLKYLVNGKSPLRDDVVILTLTS